MLLDSLLKMSFKDVVANIAQCFEDENLERLGKINDHLKDRLSTLLQKPRKILRCSIDKSANEQWKEGLLEEENIGGNELYTARLV